MPVKRTTTTFSSKAWYAQSNPLPYPLLLTNIQHHKTTADSEPQGQLLSGLSGTFASLVTLKMELLATALALFGSGSVWLVVERTLRMRILATYNAGTPYPGAHGRQQSLDTSTLSTPNSTSPYSFSYGNDILNSTAAAARRGPQGAAEFYPVPLLCVSIWPQVYMTDHGVSQEGKRDYLERWWECIDWGIVAERYPFKGGNKRSSLG